MYTIDQNIPININKENLSLTGLHKDNPILKLFEIEKEYIDIHEMNLFVSSYNYFTSIVNQCKKILSKEPFLSKTITQKVQILVKAIENNFQITEENSLLIIHDLANNTIGSDKLAFLIVAILFELNIKNIYVVNLPNHTIIHVDENHIDRGEIKADSYYIKKYKLPIKQIDNLLIPVGFDLLDANFYFNMGKYMYYKQNPEFAVANFKKTIEINPYFSEAWYYMGLCKSLLPMQLLFDESTNLTYGYLIKITLENQPNFIEINSAINNFDRAITLFPSNHMAWFARGTLHNFTGKYQDAISDYSQVITLTPDFSDAWLNRALAKYQNNDLIGAENDFKSTIQIEPEKGNIWFNYAILKLENNDIETGLIYFAKAANLSPNLFKVTKPCTEVDGQEDLINETEFEQLFKILLKLLKVDQKKHDKWISAVVFDIKAGKTPKALLRLLNVKNKLVKKKLENSE